MKLIKPINQLRNILPSAVGASGYRLLCLFMTALLFCGMNSQVMAASVLPGANNAPASGDKFNSQSFLKASNPNADDNQHWTLTEEIGAGILGAALLGGAVAGGYKCYADRNARMGGSPEAAARLRESSDGSDERQTTSNDSWSSYFRGCVISKAADSTIVDGSSTDNSSSVNEVASGWREKGAALLASLGQGAYSLGQRAYNLATLKSCLPAAKPVDAPEQSIMKRLAEFRKTQLKAKLANQQAKRSWGQFGYDLVTFKSDNLPSVLTQRQKEQLKMALLSKNPNGQVTLQENYDFQKHSKSEEDRAKAINALNPRSSLDDMYAVLDPEVKNALNELMGTLEGLQESDQNFDQNKKLLYFVAKDPETNLEHIEVIKEVLFPVSDQSESFISETVIVDGSEDIDSSGENPLKEKLLKEINDRWANDNQVNSSRKSQSPGGNTVSTIQTNKSWFYKK